MRGVNNVSYIDVVFKAMRFEHEYSPEDLQAITHLRLEDVTRSLNMLADGDMIKKTAGGRLVKSRKCKTNQRNLL